MPKEKFEPSGLWHVTGEHDTGKTIFATTSGIPVNQTYYVSDDVKESSIQKEMEDIGYPFMKFVDFRSETNKMREAELHSHFLKILGDIEKMKPKCVIWDTWSRVEPTFQPYVVAHMPEFRKEWSPMGQIKGAQTWISADEYEISCLSRLSKAAQLVILTTHLKEYSPGGRKTGKMIPNAKKAIYQVCKCRIWLRHNPDSPAPIGLVMKRIDKKVVEDGSLKVVSVLPRRIVPCTWDKIGWYWDNPLSDRPPLPNEIPNEFELSILDGHLTPDQLEMLRMGIKLSDEPLEEEKESADPELVMRVKHLKNVEGKSYPAIGNELGLSVSDVIKLYQS